MDAVVFQFQPYMVWGIAALVYVLGFILLYTYKLSAELINSFKKEK
jgi:hypothetical protein